MERVLSKPNPSERRFGLMSCDHPFCLACIRGWRANGTADLETAVRTCPLCRTTTHFVVSWRVDGVVLCSGAKGGRLAVQIRTGLGQNQGSSSAAAGKFWDGSRTAAGPCSSAFWGRRGSLSGTEQDSSRA